MNIKTVIQKLETRITKVAKTITEPTSKEIPKKVITESDKGAFRTYAMALKSKTGITPQEVNELFKKEGGEFLEAITSFLYKKSNIPETIRPSVSVQKILGDNVMQYSPSVHHIIIDSDKISSLSKAEIFGALRHELQHAKQNLDVLRHETIGEKAVNHYAKEMVRMEKEGALRIVKMSNEEIAQFGLNEAQMQEVKMYKSLYEKGEAEFNSYFDNNCNNCVKEAKESFERFRNEVIKKLGLIKEGTPASERAKVYFDDFTNLNYYNADGTIKDTALYMTRSTEVEAYLAGDIARDEALGICHFKTRKQELDLFLNNKEMVEEATRGLRENAERYKKNV